MKRLETIKGCCEDFTRHINNKCSHHGFECPDNIVQLYIGSVSGIHFGLQHPDNLSHLVISHCPWCGTNIENLAIESVVKS